jgi:23S rRNA (guanosine2251-2'-O)-methyltransferase
VAEAGSRPIALVMGAEGPGLREKTRETCDRLVRIPYAGGFGSLNVSNAAAVALYAVNRR